MLLNPLPVVDDVIKEYRSYLRTEFRARDDGLRRALETALDEPRFLAQEPFFQAYRPFKAGRAWTDLGLDPKLAAVMQERTESLTAFLHQSEAIAYLLDRSATSLAVTTGTGSGKTECFLLPVIQNAIEDATEFGKKPGLTAILVYPMNALANDQEQRIKDYLEDSGHTYVRIARYDRATSEADRAELRAKPPHILLTNYVMLEYLLVRPSDREALFKNHRCRYVVLDEVHSYRGSLGANIALLFRRVSAHLGRAKHDFRSDDRSVPRRFPRLVPVATSATIKSIDETGRTKEEITRLRREAVQEFLSALTGVKREDIRVLGEERALLPRPAHAKWAPAPVVLAPPQPGDEKGLQKTLAALAGLPESTPLERGAESAAPLWMLNELLAKKPLSLGGIVDAIIAQVAERQGADRRTVEREVRTALACGAELDGIAGALRLRVHRFIRGGWRFHRCVDPLCGKLYPMGEDRCACGCATAPLLLCRTCGADALHFAGDDDPRGTELVPFGLRESAQEWVLYDATRHEIEPEDEDDDEAPTSTRARGGKKAATKLKGKAVEEGSFEPATCSFDGDRNAHPMKVALAPARNRCLVCGGLAGARPILTSVALGTSAALRALAEGTVEGLARQHASDPDHDGKERILIFADSRQDAAHQARFITYAGRYDRMRRRLVRVLEDQRGPVRIEPAVRRLLQLGLDHGDNPVVDGGKVGRADLLPETKQERGRAWEEAPLLDDLAVTAGYRGTLFNLGLVGVRYGKLAKLIDEAGGQVASSLRLTSGQLVYLCTCILSDMRVHWALSRPMLTYHPLNPNSPDYVKFADWERRVKKPQGYPCTAAGEPVGNLDKAEIPDDGISFMNAWRRGKRGRPPRLQRMLGHLVARMGGRQEVEEADLLRIMSFLAKYGVIVPAELAGFRLKRRLLQVNADEVELELLGDDDRRRCSVCNVRMGWVEPGSPCPSCHGVLEPWPAAEFHGNRYVDRILATDTQTLVAGEHTAQVTGAERIALEEKFKGKDPLNVLACSPTLEMGIDVGGLDAVLMRNVPPRPDNYAQRGGRAGRRTRVGIVLGYARSTPHDQYFYDKPVEMIAGEVAAPPIGLGNRDVVVRHLNAIALGSAEPGLAGRMAEYITLQGAKKDEAIEPLISAFENCFDHAADLALDAWGEAILGPAGLASKEALLGELRMQPARIRDLFERAAYQIRELQERIQRWSELGVGKWSAVNAMELKKRLLGIPPDDRDRRDADDRGNGHPMRRFAEFGLLPGYEFPTEPATLRLLRDEHEEEPISVARSPARSRSGT